MKVSKLKTLLYFLGAVVILTTISVDAASLSITKSNEKTEANVVKYEVYLDASDGEVSNLTLKIQSNIDGITPKIEEADNVEKVFCTPEGVCALQANYSSKLKIVNVTLENTTEANIENLSISASIEGIGNVTSDPITLNAKKQEVTTTVAPKSSNAELSNITTSVGTMSPEFTTGGRSYTITEVKDTVNSITFNATCENCTTNFTCLDNCTISPNKNNRIMLENGANEIELVTTSEDEKNTVTYNFIVYRGEVEEPSAYLKELEIEGIELDTKFDMLLNDYTTTVDLDVEKLEIKYELEDPEAKVEIKGADKLKEGENTVTITVTSSDGASKQVYTITVNKEDVCDPETEECEKDEVKETVVVEKKKTNKVWLIVLLSVGGLSIIGLSAFLIFKKKKKNKDNDNDKNNKNDKENKIKKAFIEEETENETQIIEEQIQDNIETKEIIKPKVKPSVDEALDDLMKTKEIELNNL